MLRKFKPRLREFLKPVLPSVWSLAHYAPRPMKRPPQETYEDTKHFLRFGVVTPSFNQGAFIAETIESVLRQAYPKLSYVIQDAGSTDATFSVVQPYLRSGVSFFVEKDAGQADGINRGMEKLKDCDVVSWLNSDDLWLPNCLKRVNDFFVAHPEVEAVYGDRIVINRDGDEIGRWVLPAHDPQVLSWADFVPQETLFMRRALWDEVSGLDATFRYAMDWDVLLRITGSEACVQHLPHCLGAFRFHAAQKTVAEYGAAGRPEMERLWQRSLGFIPSRERYHAALIPYYFRQAAARLKELLRRNTV